MAITYENVITNKDLLWLLINTYLDIINVSHVYFNEFHFSTTCIVFNSCLFFNCLYFQFSCVRRSLRSIYFVNHMSNNLNICTWISEKYMINTFCKIMIIFRKLWFCNKGAEFFFLTKTLKSYSLDLPLAQKWHQTSSWSRH